MQRRFFNRRRAVLFTVLPVVFCSFAIAASSAFAAGREFITGWDPDYHCQSGTYASCSVLSTAVDFVRAGAPDPSKPVLVIDRGALKLQNTLNNLYGSSLPMQVVDPESSSFSTLPITTANYSAIIVASDESCGGCDLNTSSSTPDTDALVARKADIKAFFEAGGGVIALSGGEVQYQPTGRCDVYYSFLPLAAPTCQATLDTAYAATPNGAALGFTAADAGSPHNEFTTPAPGGPLQPAIVDGAQTVALFGAAPLATTGSAGSVTSSGATVSGTVNPEFGSTTYQFEYGTTTSYGSTAPATAGVVGSDNTSHSESQQLSGLKGGTTYHYRIVATNPSGTTYGADMTFTTAKPPTPQLTLSVSPRRARAGARTCFVFTATSGTHKQKGVTVRFDGHTAHSSSKGTAKICLAPKHKGTYRATATKSGYKTAHASVKVMAAKKVKKTTSPPFTG